MCSRLWWLNGTGNSFPLAEPAEQWHSCKDGQLLAGRCCIRVTLAGILKRLYCNKTQIKANVQEGVALMLSPVCLWILSYLKCLAWLIPLCIQTSFHLICLCKYFTLLTLENYLKSGHPYLILHVYNLNKVNCNLHLLKPKSCFTGCQASFL